MRANLTVLCVMAVLAMVVAPALAQNSPHGRGGSYGGVGGRGNYSRTSYGGPGHGGGYRSGESRGNYGRTNYGGYGHGVGYGHPSRYNDGGRYGSYYGGCGPVGPVDFGPVGYGAGCGPVGLGSFGYGMDCWNGDSNGSFWTGALAGGVLGFLIGNRNNEREPQQPVIITQPAQQACPPYYAPAPPVYAPMPQMYSTQRVNQNVQISICNNCHSRLPQAANYCPYCSQPVFATISPGF